MSTAGYLSSCQFKGFTFFIRCCHFCKIVAGHQRSPLHEALCVAFSIFQYIIPVNEPVIGDRSLTANPFCRPGDAFTGEYGICGSSDAGNAQGIINRHRTACGFHNCRFSVTHFHLEGICSRGSRGIGIIRAEIIRRSRYQCVVYVINLIGIPERCQTANGFRGQRDTIADPDHI